MLIRLSAIFLVSRPFFPPGLDIYMEAIRENGHRDTSDAAFNQSAQWPLLRANYSNELYGVVAHEVGHGPGSLGEGHDHNELGLMIKVGQQIGGSEGVFKPST